MYDIYNINRDTTCILDKYKEALFLIEGNDKALLIDSGKDEDSLIDAITLITDKPIFLALSHGHIDHIGLSNEFDKVYMNYKDLDTYKQHMTMKRGHFDCELLNFKNPDDLLEMPELFDLGNHDIVVLDLPGHTPGSVIFVDIKNSSFALQKWHH
ncbi:MAG: MBL fold metallo-hydrolase [Erysipelotrichaceae bacterium]|nr:MBL fold metallo-hydrolase [Erysipelotrichaceae bacterium]